MRILFSSLPAVPEDSTHSGGASYGVCTRLKLCVSQAAQQELVEKVSRSWNSALAAMATLRPSEAANSPLLKQARVVEKHWLLQNFKQLPEVSELSQRILAGRLGLPRDDLKQLPDLEKFAKKVFLANYLARYDDELSLEADGQVCIKHNNDMVPWSTLEEKLRDADYRDQEGRQFDWRYDSSGITLRSTHVWEDDKLPALFCNVESIRELTQPMVYLCTTSGLEPKIISGDHTWIEIEEPSSGNMYAAGLFRPEKRGRFDWLNNPFRTKAGKIRVDDAEFWGMKITRHPIQATEAQVEALKAAIEHDHAQPSIPFNIHNQNCTTWAVSKVNQHILNEPINAKVPVLRILTSASSYNTIMKASRFIPGFIKTIIRAVATVVLYLLYVILGYCKTDPGTSKVSKSDCACVETYSPFFINFVKEPHQAAPLQ